MIMDWCLEILLWNYTGSGTVGDPAYLVTSWTETNWYWSSPGSPCLETTVYCEDDRESYCISQFEEQSSKDETEKSFSSFDDLLNEKKKECSRYSIGWDSKENDHVRDNDPAICLVVKYNNNLKSLDVSIMECRNLPIVDLKKQQSNPYVKSYLVIADIKYGKRKTKVLPSSTNPKFYELFRYFISKSDLHDSELLVTVWHYNKYGRNFRIGQMTVRFDEFCFGEPYSKWYKLEQNGETYHPCFML
ncbi:synaptotagmin-like protein 5 [Saccostrea echinata]|uniref:synaptotagmin-like protein 5 n=1 Tax=Saccostrea echinata TaxID=191078 RepID=UPI002A7FDD47|nr:synaptotagmin-like protein 5 [Saccostrea echinata]